MQWAGGRVGRSIRTPVQRFYGGAALPSLSGYAAPVIHAHAAVFSLFFRRTI